jgi:uncharacterized protein
MMKLGERVPVTGASSGIGESYAETLAGLGMNLVLVARRKDRLRDLAARLQKAYGIDARPLPADLADPGDLARVEEELHSRPTSLLLNNAGFGAYMPFTDLPADRAEELVRVKVVAPTRLARAAVPSMLENGGGAIVNVASLLGFSGAFQMPQLPRRVTYGPLASFSTKRFNLADN